MIRLRISAAAAAGAEGGGEVLRFGDEAARAKQRKTGAFQVFLQRTSTNPGHGKEEEEKKSDGNDVSTQA